MAKFKKLTPYKVTDKIYVLADDDENVVYKIVKEWISPNYKWVPYKPNGTRISQIGTEIYLPDIISRLEWGV